MTDDLIIRADAIEAIDKQIWSNIDIPICKEIRSAVKKTIEQLPSAQPKQGAWINKHEWANGFYERECSICGAMKPILMHTAKMNYCPNCGADMRKETVDYKHVVLTCDDEGNWSMCGERKEGE